MSDIKLFRLHNSRVVKEVFSGSMGLEKQLQTLFEKNLDSLMNIKFLASEHPTTDSRIDTLGLDENNCPVIIEYKRKRSENITNQGLFYLDWLMDHKADFKWLVKEKIDEKKAKDIDWASPRLICVAADFNRFDIHAVKQNDRNIELIRYRKYGDDLLMLDLLTSNAISAHQPSPSISDEEQKRKNTKSNKKSSNREWSTAIIEASDEQKMRYEELRKFIQSLGDDVQERSLKFYVAFMRMKNFACVELKKKGTILVYVKLDPKKTEMLRGFTRDVSGVGHLGTGDVQITISSDKDLDRAKPIIEKSYDA